MIDGERNYEGARLMLGCRERGAGADRAKPLCLPALLALLLPICGLPSDGFAWKRRALDPGLAMFCAGHLRSSHWGAHANRCAENVRLLTMDVLAASIEVITGRQMYEPARYDRPSDCSGDAALQCALIGAYAMAGQMTDSRADAVRAFLDEFPPEVVPTATEGRSALMKAYYKRRRAANCAMELARVLAPIGDARFGTSAYVDALGSAVADSGQPPTLNAGMGGTWLGRYAAQMPVNRDAMLLALTRDLVGVRLDLPKDAEGWMRVPSRAMGFYYLMALRHRDAAVTAFERVVKEERVRFVELWGRASQNRGWAFNAYGVSSKRYQLLNLLDQIPGLRAPDLSLDELLPRETRPPAPAMEISSQKIMHLVIRGAFDPAEEHEMMAYHHWKTADALFRPIVVERIRGRLHPMQVVPKEWPWPVAYGYSIDEPDGPPVSVELAEYLPCP